MNRIIVTLLALMVSVGFAHSANVDFRKNHKTQFQFFYYFSGINCRAGPKTKHKVTKEPKNGSLSFAWISQVPHGKVKNKCRGKPTKGLAVYYTPNRGFKGKDKFSYRLGFPEFVNGTRLKWRTFSINANVK